MQEANLFIEADKSLVSAAKSIKILSSLGWSESHTQRFLSDWNRGQVKLPEISYPTFSFHEERQELERLIHTMPEDHPVGWYIGKTAQSYLIAAQMLEGLGTKAFTECSIRLYGRPDERFGKLCSLEIADDFISITEDYAALIADATTSSQMRTDDAVVFIKERADQFFGDHKVKVVAEPHLGSKATAGSERVRIRGDSLFSMGELEQLLQHEVFVHSSTMLNGRSQPYLKSMGLGAPRTTATQEGLATFAELISGTMDLSRLRRIALRIKAIHFALNGADFIEIFKFFLEAGQSELDSFQSAARVFRGGDLHGTNVFTKDVVYLKGLLSVHAFLRKAIQERKHHYPQRLFAGRLTVGDVIRLDDAFDDGWVAEPKYLAPWAANRESLAAYLCFNAFSNRLRLDEIRLEDFTYDVVSPSESDDF